jgi:hypothetical protein
MDLRKEILKEHSLLQKNKIIDYVGNVPSRFSKLVTVFLEGPYRVTQRASWPLSCCVEEHPELVKPHLLTLLKSVRKPGVHDSVKRNVMRLLQFIDIPKNLEGKVAEECFRLFNDKKEPVAVRVFAMTVLGNVALKNPELQNEVRILIEDSLPTGSAALLSRGRKILKSLKK